MVALIGGGYLALVRAAFFAPTTITAYFPAATAIYPGDDVRVSGVKVGTIDSIQPEGTQTKMVFNVNHGVPVPADAKAIIVAQNLVAARYVQLTPAYRTSPGGPKMADGAVIPLERTGVPVEWDEVKKQLERLATDLGPSSDVSTTSVGRFIDSAANALDGNGDKAAPDARRTLRSGADSRRGKRKLRRHHQESAGIRYGVARQQHPDSCSSTTGWRR